jgi:uncharacterized protein
MVKKYVVKKSKIHGKGVFAIQDIKKGEKIVQYLGKKITKKESEIISNKLQEKAKKNKNIGEVYIFDLNKKYDLDGNIQNNPAKYINHSCEPNAETEQDEKNKIWITAIKNIKKNEEINYNYGYDIENYKNTICKCNSKNCIGYILDEKYWKKIK